MFILKYIILMQRDLPFLKVVLSVTLLKYNWVISSLGTLLIYFYCFWVSVSQGDVVE